MTRSNLIWVSLVVILTVGIIVYVAIPDGSQNDATGSEASKNAPAKAPRATPSSKGDRRLDFAKAENRDGIIYDKDGNPFTGTLEKEHAAGSRAAQIPMKDGVADGVMKSYDENGTLRVRAVYENGKLVSKEEWDKDGKKLGEDDARDPYGTLLAERERERQPYTPGAVRPVPLLDAVSPAEGIEIGQLQLRGGVNYRTDNRQPYTGRALRRFSDGSEWVRNYENGVAHGEFKYTYPNGRLHSTETYVNGKKDGLYTMYFENGQKRYESEIESGKQVGIATSWNQQGQVISRWEHTEDGKRINLLATTTPNEDESGNPAPPAAGGAPDESGQPE